MMQMFLERLRAAASLRAAVVGDGAGNVLVSGRANYMYARLGGADGERVQVRATLWASALAEGETLLVQRDTGGDLAQWRAVFKL